MFLFLYSFIHFCSVGLGALVASPSSPEADLNRLNLNIAHPVTLLNLFPADASSISSTLQVRDVQV
jgi:hypothetical protein